MIQNGYRGLMLAKRFAFSGSHMNPAVSFSYLIRGRMTVNRCLLYIVAQTVGAFVGSIFTYILYRGEYEKYQNM